MQAEHSRCLADAWSEQLLDILSHPVYLLLHFLERAAPRSALTYDVVRTTDRGDRFVVVRRPVGVAVRITADRPRTEANLGNLHSRAAQRPLLHDRANESACKNLATLPIGTVSSKGPVGIESIL